MINNLSARLTDKLLSKGSITEDERELYIYGLFMLISQLLYLVLACIFGLLFQCFIESIAFYIAFQFIRRYAGGYHAATETRCEILSTLSIIASIGIIKLSKIYDFKTILLFITLVSVVLIFFLCPLDTPEKPLSEKEFKYFRKISWIILLVISSIIIVSYFFKFNILFTPCCVSLILESILLVAGKIKRVPQEKSVKN
ncbi:accessory gene regulator B family protein [uncultured Eubacterium sp.]|uniref:accessory gene regulator ArgB-like protein n=1 Tax=uncultured Eubacterium sp. TaxID=165185 RepID=UPI00342220A0